MKDSTKKEGLETLKDIIISVAVVGVIFFALYAYSGIWPPIVVVESGSMQHGSESHIGTIDTGDIVIVKKIYSPDDVTTYIEGRLNGYETYGNYGDVLIYDYNGESIIHRAIVYLTWTGYHWKIRGWSPGQYSLELKIENMFENRTAQGTVMSAELVASQVGDKLRIYPEDIKVKYAGAGMTPKISISTGKLKNDSIIRIKNVLLEDDTCISIYDERTKGAITSLISYWHRNGRIKFEYPNWLYLDNTPGQEMLTIYNVTMSDVPGKKMIMIHLDSRNLNHDMVGDEGFITMGDHNLLEFGPTAYDQNGADGYSPICPKLVSYSMIEGVARGELPWFGAIKLYMTGTNTHNIPSNTNLWLGVSIVTLIALSFLADYAIDHRREIIDKIKQLLRKDSET